MPLIFQLPGLRICLFSLWVDLQLKLFYDIRYQSCWSCGGILWNCSRDFLSKMLCWDTKQEVRKWFLCIYMYISIVYSFFTFLSFLLFVLFAYFFNICDLLCKRDHEHELVISSSRPKILNNLWFFFLSILRFLHFRKEPSFAYFSVQDGCSTHSQSSMRSIYFQPLVTVLHCV